MRTILVVGVSVCVAAAPAGATELSDLAATLEPGDWAELETQDLEPTIQETLGIGATGSIFPYSEDGVWDPVNRRFLFLGSDHIYDGESSRARFVAYDEADNRWSVLPDPPWVGNGTMHGYDHSAVLDGRLYHQTLIRGQPLREMDLATGEWSDRASLEETGYNRFGGLEPFPALGGLVYVEAGLLFLWERDADEWSVLDDSVAMGDYHNFAEYDPVHEVVLFGGGNDSALCHVLSSDRNVRDVPDAPFPLRVNEAIVTVDPVSGDYLVLGGAGAFWVFDSTSDTWSEQAEPAPFFDNRDGAVDLAIAGPIADHGVVMFVQHVDTGDTPEAQVWIYRHAPFVAPPDPDGGPGEPDAGPGDGDVDADVDVDAEVDADGDGDGDGDADVGAAGDEGGCSCRTPGARTGGVLWLALLACLALRRKND